MSFEPVEWEPDDYSKAAPAVAPEPNVPGPPLRKRPIPDQLDYYSDKLAPLVDPARLDREALLAVGATLVGLGYIASQLRIQLLPSITDGISDAEAEASAALDLTIDEVRALHPDDAAVAEVRAWIPDGTPDHALIELEAHTLHGVLAEVDVATERVVKAERELVDLRAKLAHSESVVDAFHAEADRMSDRYDNLRGDYDRASAALAEARERIGEPETEWGHQDIRPDGWLGDIVINDSEESARFAMNHMRRAYPDARFVLKCREVWHAETEWRVVDDAA